MPKHYEVEYTIQGSFIDTVYDVDNKQEAMALSIADLEVRPLPITKDNVTVTSAIEIDYESGLKKENTNSVDQFFDDLEAVLTKHLGSDWEWSYEHDKPLLITSESLAKAWEESEEK